MTRQLISVLLAVSFATVSQAQIVTQLTDVKPSLLQGPRMTDDGTAAFVVSTADLVGLNPRHRWHIFRFDLTTGDVEQVTRFSQGVMRESFFDFVFAAPAVSDDGLRIAFVSRENLTGANQDFGPELFVMNVDGTALLQLTAGTGAGKIGHIAMAGDGTRIVFDADYDYTGGNPNRGARIFIVDDDGSNLLQLSPEFARLPFISDDGERIVFFGGTWPVSIQAVEASGANLRGLTHFASFPMAISGDGSTVVFLGDGSLAASGSGPRQHTCPDPTTIQVGVVDWDGSDETWLTCIQTGATTYGSAFAADVTDDGQTIFYTGEDVGGALFRVERDGTGTTALVPSTTLCPRVAVAGSGSRIAFTCAQPFPYRNIQLFSAAPDGGDLEQLTETPAVGGHSWHPVISAVDGRVVFLSDANLLGEGPYPGLQLYSTSTDGSNPERLTSLSLTAPSVGNSIPDSVAVSADGTIAVFHDDEAGPLYIVDTDTAQAIEVPGVFFTPDVDDDGNQIVAVSGSGLMIHEIAPDGSTTTPLVQGLHPRLDGAGSLMVYERNGLVYSMVLATLSEKIIGPGFFPDVSRAGDRIVFESTTNALGTNPDGNSEIFTRTTAGIVQLTFTEVVNNQRPAISGDGAWVYYLVAEDDWSDLDIARVHTTSLEVERVGGLRPCRMGGFDSEYPLPDPPGVLVRVSADHDGSRAVFHGGADCSGHNGDGGIEVYLIDRATPPTLRLGSAQPTLLTWEAGSGPYLYDVMRGDLTSLEFDGSAIDLGWVTCVENDSVDNATLAAEDEDLPAPGQAYFYLVRGLPGGDYGGSTTGVPRVPGFGDCPE